MANFACNCGSLNNLGTPSCESVQSVTKKLIYVPLYNSAGVRNGIDITDVIDSTYITARLNDTDETQRWYPSPLIENVEDTKADSIFESLNSGSNIFIQEGARTFSGMHIKQSTVFLGKLKSGRCVDFGVYMIDIDGNLTGSVSADGQMLYPVAVDKETFNPTLVKATDTTVAKIMVTFEFSRVERDENLRTISANEISVNLLTINGLIDGYFAVTNDTVNGLTATVYTDYGSFNNKIKIEGLLLADFSVYNNTADSAVSIATVTEDNGVYTITFTTPQTLADSITITATETGFSFVPTTYTI